MPPTQACKVHNPTRARSFAMERAALEALTACPHPAFPILVGCNEAQMLLFTRPVVKPLGGLGGQQWAAQIRRIYPHPFTHPVVKFLDGLIGVSSHAMAVLVPPRSTYTYLYLPVSIQIGV